MQTGDDLDLSPNLISKFPLSHFTLSLLYCFISSMPRRRPAPIFDAFEMKLMDLIYYFPGASKMIIDLRHVQKMYVVVSFSKTNLTDCTWELQV